MKLALVGYGKMGRMLDELAPKFGLDVQLRLDEHNNAGGKGLTEANFKSIDVAIEFSTPETCVPNIEGLAALGIPTVVGTTGWMNQLEHVQSLVKRHDSALVWSPNFSVGVQVFANVVSDAAALLSHYEEYGAWAWEIHHSAKKDAPSGTLLKLVEGMRGAGYERPIDVSSNRAGAVPGTHEIGFDSPADTLTLKHTARSREGFASGALRAARWVVGKKGCYDFGSILFKEKL